MDFDAALRFLTDPKIQRIAQDQSRTVYQRAADIAALDVAEAEEPKVRKQRKMKPIPDAPTSNGEGLI